MKNRLIVILDEVPDKGKIIEKTASFEIETSEEFADDLFNTLFKDKDKKYKIRWEKA